MRGTEGRGRERGEERKGRRKWGKGERYPHP